MDTPDQPVEQRAPDAPSRVAAVVIANASGDLTEVFSSIDRQVYEPAALFVVSPEQPKASVAAPHARWAPSIPEVLTEMRTEADFVWIVDAQARPRPDALGALVETAERVDAAVVGSKLLSAARPDELVSVGGATDVFGFPYTGIEDGEVDQEQYDVIRDVAYVEPASMLVRRDLAAGLGGLDGKLPYLSAGLDFSQRARLTGGRVVVGPTSEVLHAAANEARPLTWREQAGRIRSMVKAYSLVTLLWTIPGLFAIGLLLSAYRTFNGAPLALLDWARAWLWNLVHVPSTLAERRRARAVRTTGDEELFRYQVKGSVEVRAVASAVGALLQGEVDEDERDLRELLDSSPGFWQQPAFLAAIFGSVFVAAITRSIWSEGVPITGFTLPLAADGWDVLRAYAGGWHLAGLGSPSPMHPSIAATAALQLPFGSRTALAATVMTIGAVALGMAGVTRFVRRLGLGHAARYFSGAVFVAGVPLLSLLGEGYWPALLAAAGLPWVLASIVQPVPKDRRALVGRAARTGLAAGWTAMMVPLLIVVPIGFGAAWSLATRRLGPLVRAAVATALALPLMVPWLLAQTAERMVTAGEPFHFDPTWWAVAPAFVAAGAVVLAGRGAPARVAVIGTLLGSVGILAARSADLGAGRDLTAAGGVLAALGVAMVVAGAFDALGPLDSAGAIRRTIVRVGMAGAIATVLLVLVAIPSGRAGLAADEFGSLAFTESRAGSQGAARVLLIGPGTSMPGEFRRMEDGTAYRLVGGLPTFPEAWLSAERIGDRALGSSLQALADGSELRPGASLADFGVRWVVFTGETPLADMMTSQLDLRPLPQLVFPVFESEVQASRAITDGGAPWMWEGPDYVGRPFEGRVRLAENADPRWGPEPWEQLEWANEVGAETGVARFSGVPAFRFGAQFAGVLAVVLMGLAIWGRPTRARRP